MTLRCPPVAKIVFASNQPDVYKVEIGDISTEITQNCHPSSLMFNILRKKYRLKFHCFLFQDHVGTTGVQKRQGFLHCLLIR